MTNRAINIADYRQTHPNHATKPAQVTKYLPKGLTPSDLVSWVHVVCGQFDYAKRMSIEVITERETDCET